MEIEILNMLGNLKVSEPYSLFGMVTGHTEVNEGGDLYVYGSCGQGMTVHEGGRAVIYGVVLGDVTNKGGELHVYGVITGEVHNIDGDTIVDPDAVVAHGWTL